MTRLSKQSVCSLKKHLLGAALLGLGLSACATTGLTRQDVIRQYAAVAKLSDGLEDVRGRDGALLAPALFERTKKQLDQAVEYARDADKPGADAAAQRGLVELQKFPKALASAREVMNEVIDIRARARSQGAAILFEESFGEADERFRASSRLIERGEVDKARKTRSAMIAEYAKLELAALKKGTVAAAKKAIAAAEEADADDNAPKTLQNAREELKLALSVLDADRTRVTKGNVHASRATWLARRARVISELIELFEQQDFSGEDRLIWYQVQLQRVRAALRDEELPFDQPNAKVIQALRADALALKSVMKDIRRTNKVAMQRVQLLEQGLDTQRTKHQRELRGLLTDHQQQLAAMSSGSRRQMSQAQQAAAAQVGALKQRLSAQAQAQAEAARREDRAQARFGQSRLLFDAAEADVFRQGENVLIRLKGFGFSPGKHQVEARNYALLNKVVAAINIFPMSRVTITGHTDARGSNSRNLELSAARAQSVVGFLSTVGGVTASRLSASGKGEEQPLASNKNAEGRSKNRRIDLLIVNTEAPGRSAAKKGQPSARR